MRIEYITEKLLDDAGIEMYVSYRAIRLQTISVPYQEPENEWELVIDNVEILIADKPIDITAMLTDDQKTAIIEQLQNYR